jgi:S1-C subfamily serine protease
VKVVSVLQGSRAEGAGLRVGDVIWRAHVPNAQGKEGHVGVIEPHLPANPVNFGYLLGRAEGLDAVTLDVLRDGECMQVVLPLK